jgi:hypothetical protein
MSEPCPLYPQRADIPSFRIDKQKGRFATALPTTISSDHPLERSGLPRSPKYLLCTTQLNSVFGLVLHGPIWLTKSTN